MEFNIEKQWNGQPTGHSPITLSLSSCSDGLKIELTAPFFNDPPAPATEAGQPCPQLWDYEVVEIFFLAKDEKYLELEFCPHGQHLALLLNGCRNIVKQQLPLPSYTASISGSTWTGCVHIPRGYFPPGVCRCNAFAIHGSEEDRMYEALFPVPHDKFSHPDFHRLEYFQTIELSTLLPGNETEEVSEIWTNAIS